MLKHTQFCQSFSVSQNHKVRLYLIIIWLQTS